MIFDIGNVLEVNPRTRWAERWARRLQIDPPSFEQRLGEVWAPGSIGASSLEEIERETAATFGLDEVRLGELMDDAWSEYVGTLNHELTDYFIRVRRRYRTGILSNSFVGAREREEKLYRFGEMCEVVVYSHEEGCLKPDPRIYRTVCARLDVAPEAAVFLDDVQENVDGAIAVGMQAIRFRDNAQAMTELGALLSE